MKYIKNFLLLILLFFYFFNVNTSDKIGAVRNFIEGRYELVSWEHDNKEFKYPKVSGTLIVQNNQFTITLNNNMEEKNYSKIIGWGNYTLSSEEFKYGFFDFKKIVRNDGEIIVKKDSPWKGMRIYKVYLKKNKLILKTSDQSQTWILDNNSLVYIDEEWDGKKALRRWKRIN